MYLPVDHKTLVGPQELRMKCNCEELKNKAGEVVDKVQPYIQCGPFALDNFSLVCKKCSSDNVYIYRSLSSDDVICRACCADERISQR